MVRIELGLPFSSMFSDISIFRLLNTMLSVAATTTLLIYTKRRRALGIIIHTVSISGMLFVLALLGSATCDTHTLDSAYAAYIAGILINVVGFAGASKDHDCFTYPHYRDAHVSLPAGRTVPIGATRVYEMSFFTGFGVSALVYYALNRLFPVTGFASKWAEVDVSNFGTENTDSISISEAASSTSKDATAKDAAVQMVYDV
jgi:hypothetical protein